MQLPHVSVVAALVVVSQAAWAPPSAISCQELVLPVSATADNINLPSNFTLANVTLDVLEHIHKFGTRSVSGQYNIAARYCAPRKSVARRAQTLQILVHGLTYTRNYWSGLAAPGKLPGQDQYSWIEYAGAQGYPTLSVDRLCNGNSSHPDGVTACQASLETATLQAVIEQARSGQIPGVSTRFRWIVLAGHSYGSLVATQLVSQAPATVDALLLTGFSYNLTNAIAGFALPQLEPAAQAEPGVYGNLPPSYYAATNQTGIVELFYYGNYTQAETNIDFAQRGTTTVGEAATQLLGQVPVPHYKGALLVLDGAEDGPFCQTVPGATPATHPGNCSDPTIDPAIRRNYPNASPYAVSNTPSTGHCLNLHLTAQESFAAAHKFLAHAGF